MANNGEESRSNIDESMIDGVENHRTPSDGGDSLAVASASITQGKRIERGTLQVLNGKKVGINLSETSIKAMPGGFEEVNGKEDIGVDEPEK